MKMDPQWIIAICAAAGLLITWTTATAGVALWLANRFEAIKKEIMADFKIKHEENAQKVEAMRMLVMRHDLILEPEFNGSASGYRRAKQ